MVEKAAWLYRHCNGDSVVDRLMVLFMNFGLAYKSVLPSFHPFDLMVGLVGAAALKAVIYFKGKNAKKYRQGEEYGSARWSAYLIAALPVALAHATPTQARRVHAYYIAGIKQPEIARREGIHSSKVSVAIHRGLRNMRRCYDDLFQTE
jgi:phosphatidylglycerophosphate synthase